MLIHFCKYSNKSTYLSNNCLAGISLHTGNPSGPVGPGKPGGPLGPTIPCKEKKRKTNKHLFDQEKQQ